MGIMAYALLRVMQDLYHQPYLILHEVWSGIAARALRLRGFESLAESGMPLHTAPGFRV